MVLAHHRAGAVNGYGEPGYAVCGGELVDLTCVVCGVYICGYGLWGKWCGLWGKWCGLWAVGVWVCDVWVCDVGCVRLWGVGCGVLC